MEGVRASWIFIMTSPVYWLWYGGHTQVRLSGLQELGGEEGGSILIAHIRDIKESAGSRLLDRWRWPAAALGLYPLIGEERSSVLQSLYIVKTHHYIIFFVRPCDIPSREWSYCSSGMELLFIEYRTVIMVGVWYYNQSGATELLIMRDFHYGRMSFKTFKTLRALHS